MDKNNFMWLLECCLLASDGYSKIQLIEFGAPPGIAAAGIKLYKYLIDKELNVYND